MLSVDALCLRYDAHNLSRVLMDGLCAPWLVMHVAEGVQHAPCCVPIGLPAYQVKPVMMHQVPCDILFIVQWGTGLVMDYL